MLEEGESLPQNLIVQQQQSMAFAQAQIAKGPPKPKSSSGLRNRGNRQQSLKMANSVQGPLAARLPSAGRRRTGSGSRHGSKKRATKTRSSLNINVSGPLLQKYERGTLGQVSSNTAFKS